MKETTRNWRKPLVFLMRTKTIIDKTGHTSKCHQNPESPEEQKPDKHDLRNRWFTTNNFTSFNLLIYEQSAYEF